MELFAQEVLQVPNVRFQSSSKFVREVFAQFDSEKEASARSIDCPMTNFQPPFVS
jgi:hypothetical protein